MPNLLLDNLPLENIFNDIEMVPTYRRSGGFLIKYKGEKFVQHKQNHDTGYAFYRCTHHQTLK